MRYMLLSPADQQTLLEQLKVKGQRSKAKGEVTGLHLGPHL